MTNHPNRRRKANASVLRSGATMPCASINADKILISASKTYFTAEDGTILATFDAAKINPDLARHARAFNEWMRRFTQAPEEFGKQFEDAAQYLRDRNEGREPSYGDVAAAYFAQMLAETA